MDVRCPAQVGRDFCSSSLTDGRQVFYAYTYSTAGWLSLQGLALTTIPQLMSTMLLEEARPATCT